MKNRFERQENERSEHAQSEVRDIPGQQNSVHCRALVLMDTGKGFEQFHSSLLDGALETWMRCVL